MAKELINVDCAAYLMVSQAVNLESNLVKKEEYLILIIVNFFDFKKFNSMCR